MLRQSRAIGRQRSASSRGRSGILRPRNSGGAGTGRASRAANSFWPKNQPIRAIWAVSKASLSKDLAIDNQVYRPRGFAKGAKRGHKDEGIARELPGEQTAMPRFRTLDDLDVAGKRVLLRADLTLPVNDRKSTDATRIERLAPTIEALIEKGAKIVV